MEDNYPEAFIDIVFCIDTSNMTPLLKVVNELRYTIVDELVSASKKWGGNKVIGQVRVRTIVFGNDSVEDMNESPFFILPEQVDEFGDHIARLEAENSRNRFISGLEALSRAIHSDWWYDTDA